MLLEAFLASNRSERAFTALVESLDRLVFSAALRRTGQAQLAEEVSQNVFAILARKASSLQKHPCLEAWAMETTRLEANPILRSEQRRMNKIASFARETEVLSSTDTASMNTSEQWQAALPHLDDALERLPMKDRRLIIERFYHEKKFREISAANDESEDACKKRLKRSLDKLSKILSARGATLSATALAMALGTELARSAPFQAAALMAPKAIAAASSISTTTLLTNTLLTMSSTKTTTLTIAAVIALAAIPFSQQLAEARRMEIEINAVAAEETPDAKLLTRSSSRMTGGTGSARTPSRLLASLSAAKSSREILRDLCSFDGMISELARQRVARMSNEERAERLAEVWRFPCGFNSRDGLLSFIVGSNRHAPPDVMLDQIIAGGPCQAFTAGSTLDDNLLTRWAKKDPAAAVQWFEKKLASEDLIGGLGDQR
jgi:RNA polymerase sigma factor (sigma-70 family)